MMVRKILAKIAEERKQAMTAKMAKGKGLERKGGYGNYGPVGQDIVTHRAMDGEIKNVPLHQVGYEPMMRGEPMPPLQPNSKSGR